VSTRAIVITVHSFYACSQENAHTANNLLIVQAFDGDIHATLKLAAGTLQQVRFLGHGPLVAVLDDTNQISIFDYERTSVLSTKRFSESVSLLYASRFHECLLAYSAQSAELSFLEVNELTTQTLVYINEAVT